MNFGRLAVVAGVATGLLSTGGSLFSSFAYPSQCPSGAQCASSPWSVITILGALGILLIFDSAISYVGPRRAFYGETGVSVLIAVLLVSITGEASATYFWLTLTLALLAAVLSLVAAIPRSALTEQSNPMNLPVFG
ncbi:MAG: hypothetical protein OK438_02630 [Thaumarchaeota archaeon]|nr:hypothetical protein [Nitrososphaerota archaeon]